ncbi:protein phosphatase 2C domain-containing protein [Nonomuraea jiangxiensis]|uniref:Protein phosphatase 2C n=1 Tax=Nonomuraea jiangxiensis TaxID=633440 RepID=A0A1G9QM13_9ACTN|nr:protein phosphatase 2C domain-containing protein [Nonomuraea jiangxiensis]SDM12006.1 Protein phosphatase 2C [Nonomuraea jiangxiensis]
MIRAALVGLLLVIGTGQVGARAGPAPEPTVTVTVTPAPRQGAASGWPLWILFGLAGGGAVLLGQLLLRRRTRTSAGDRTPLGPLPQPLPVLLAGGADSRAPGVALDGGMLAQTTVRAVSLRGRRHRYRGEPLQDAYAVRLSADGRWVIAAVADGLGSTLHAEHAAAVAVRAATRLSLTPDRGWHAAFATVAWEVMRATAGLGGQTYGRPGSGAPDPPATTLTIGVVPADGRRGIAACAAIGDSPALWLHDGAWTEIFPPEGPRPGNVTSALPEDLGELRERQIDWGPGDVLVLCSDGFGTALGGGGSALAQRLVTSWSSPPALRSFLCDVDFQLSTYDDDRTVLALWAGRHDTAVR